jgi:transposase
MEILEMSSKERRRLRMMTAVKSKELTLVQAAEAMGVSYRQAKRIWKRYQKAGDAGLIHCSRGRIGSRRIEPEQRQKILRRFRQRYSDFGPTLAAEYLTKDGWEVDHETLRRWLLEDGASPPEAPAVAGAQGLLWADGANGRFASRLV